MRISKKTDAELVIADSSMWLSAIFAAFACMPIGITISNHTPNGFYAGAFLLLFAVVWMRKTRFTFDGQQRLVRWTARKIFKVESGIIPFDDIRDIGVQTRSSDKGVIIYRLSILTAQGEVPMEASYNSGRASHAKIREAVLAFIHRGETAETTQSSARTFADDSMIGSLITQGRKMDAVRLLRSAENLSLTEATQRIEAMEAKLNVDVVSRK